MRLGSRGLFILIISGCLATGCQKSQPAQANAGPGAMPVGIQTVQAKPVNDYAEYVATLKSRASSVINPQVSGQIIKIYVKSGDHVVAGTPLIQIDPLKQQATVDSQERQHATQVANVRYAKQQLERTQQLAADGVVSKQDLDQAQASYDAAQATLESLDSQVSEQKEQLRYYRVSAPTDGIVGDIPVRVGDSVTPATTLTTVDKPGSLEAYISVPIERASQLKIGQPVQIVDATGKILADSHVSFVSAEVSDQTQSVLVKASIENPRDKLRTDQFIRARVIWDTEPRPLVPVLAISRLNGQPFVFVAESKPDKGSQLFAHLKPVKLGDTLGNDYVVLDGLKPGDQLIVSGTQMLADGAPVVAVPPQGSAQAGAPGSENRS